MRGWVCGCVGKSKLVNHNLSISVMTQVVGVIDSVTWCEVEIELLKRCDGQSCELHVVMSVLQLKYMPC